VHFEAQPPAPAQRQLVLPKYLRGLGGSKLEGELAAFVEACRQKDERSRWYLNQQLFVLLSHIGHHGKREAASPDLADRLERYLSGHVDRPFSAKELEKTFFLSYKHMAAVFKKSMGETMLSYHQRLRMEEGARLLRETLLPVGEISDRLGFGDQLYFSRCFHSYAGVSPSRYRKEIPDY
jgi:AraC-like DNA-binding protein